VGPNADIAAGDWNGVPLFRRRRQLYFLSGFEEVRFQMSAGYIIVGDFGQKMSDLSFSRPVLVTEGDEEEDAH
jgi:hypothetical protein